MSELFLINGFFYSKQYKNHTKISLFITGHFTNRMKGFDEFKKRTRFPAFGLNVLTILQSSELGCAGIFFCLLIKSSCKFNSPPFPLFQKNLNIIKIQLSWVRSLCISLL